MANPWDKPIGPDPSVVSADLAMRLLRGEEKPGRLGKSLLSGILELPSVYLGLAGQAANFDSTTPDLSSVPALQRAQQSIRASLPELAKDLKAQARTAAGIPEGPQTAYERAANDAGGVILDPLSYLGSGAGLVKRLGIGLLPNAALSVAGGELLHQVAPESKPETASTPSTETFAGATTTQMPWEVGASTQPAMPWEKKDDNSSLINTAILGGTGALVAAVLGKKLFFPSAASHGTKLTVGVPQAASAVPVSGTTPGEAIRAVQGDQASILESQANRSMAHLPQDQPMPAQPQTDIFSLGVPEQDTFGARRAALGAANPRPIVPPSPFLPTDTPNDIKTKLHASISASIPEATATIIEDFMRTGAINLPDGTVRRGPAFQSLVREASLKPGVPEAAQRAFGIEQALDDFYRTGEAPTLTTLLGSRGMVNTPTGVSIPNALARGRTDPQMIAQARAELAQLKANPDVNHFVEGMKAIPRFLAEIAPEFGISRKLMQKFMAAHPNFMPIAEKGKEPIKRGFFQRIREMGNLDQNVARTLEQFEAMTTRRAEIHGGGVQFPESFAESLGHYISGAIHTFRRNDAKRKLFYILRNSGDNDIKRSFSVYHEQDQYKGAKGADWFYDGNTRIGVKFADALMQHSFSMAPHTIRWPLMNGIRKMMQQTVTGLLNPAFAFSKAIFYDTEIAKAVRPAGTKNPSGVFGRVGLSRVGVDPFAVVEDAYRGGKEILTAKAAIADAEALERQLALNTPWARDYDAVRGPGSLRRLADQLTQAYIDSNYATLRRSGAIGSTQYLERTMSQNMSRLDRIVPEWHDSKGPTAAYQMWTGYKAILEGLTNANRMMYYVRNKGRAGVEHEAGELLGTFVRRGTGTISVGKGEKIRLREPRSVGEKAMGVLARGAAGRLGQSANSVLNETVPYFNVAVQSTRLLGKRLKEQPLTTIGGLTSTVVVPSMLSAALLYHDDEARQFWLSQPGYVRASTMYFRLPGLPANQGLFIPIPPELGILHSLVFYGINEALGTNTGFVQDDINDAILSYTNIFTPLPLQAFSAAMGMDLQTRANSYAGVGGLPIPGLRPGYNERVTGEGVHKRPGALYPGWAEGLATTLAGQAFQTFLGFLEAGTQTMKRGGHLGDAIEAGFTQMGNDMARRTPVFRPIHGFFNQPAIDNTKRRLMEKTRIVDQVTTMFDQMGFKQGGPSTMSGYGLGGTKLDPGQVPDWARDPVKMQRAMKVKVAFDMDPGLREVSQLRNHIRSELEKMRGTRPVTKELQQRINVAQHQELGLTEAMYKSLKAKEAALGFKIEDTFK